MTSSLQNCERNTFLVCEAPSLWRFAAADLGNENTRKPGDGTQQEPRAGGRATRVQTAAGAGPGRPGRAQVPPRLGLGLHAPLTGLQWAPNPSPDSRLTTTPQGKPKGQSSPVYEELRSRQGLQRAPARAAGARTASWRAPLLRIPLSSGPLVLAANPLWRPGQTPAQESGLQTPDRKSVV